MLKLKSKFKQMSWFAAGFMLGLTGFSVGMASVPAPSRITDDTAIYQQLSEIRVPKQGKVNFDSDIAQLARLERRYHETLPALDPNARLKTPMSRIGTQKYRPSAAQ